MARTRFSSVFPNTTPSSSPVSEKRRKGRRDRRREANQLQRTNNAVASVLKRFGV